MNSDYDALATLDVYDVVWQIPGKGERDMMPLGNGTVGVMLWTIADGRVEFYLARPDAITELDRMVKLGKVSLKLEPNPFATEGFRQMLRLRDGTVVIEAGSPGSRVRLKVSADADAPVIRVTGRSDLPLNVSARYTTWRIRPQVRNADYILKNFQESADIVESVGDAVVFFHRNETSCVPTLAKLEVPGFESTVRDPYLHRTFGGRMTLSGARDAKDGQLSVPQVRAFELRVATHSQQTETLEQWKAQLAEIGNRDDSPAHAQAATAAWWNAYWARSWIFVSNDPFTPSANTRPPRAGSAAAPPSKITQACVLTRFMTACAARGAYPIHWGGLAVHAHGGSSRHHQQCGHGGKPYR